MLTSAEIDTLRAALPIIQKIITESRAAAAEIAIPDSLPRTEDGRHLTPEAISILYEFFERGGTAYGAVKQFGIYFGSARDRHRMWKESKESLAQ